ncbi:MAG: hypothetical protein R3B70_46785, partial [Polyangiaceae bacterium]
MEITGDEHDIEAMLRNPIADRARAIARLVWRQRALPAESAVVLTLELVEAMLDAYKNRRYMPSRS